MSCQADKYTIYHPFLCIFRRQGGVHLPQWGGSQHGDLKEAGRFRGVLDILPAVFVYRNRMLLCMEICEELRYNFDVESEQEIGIS